MKRRPRSHTAAFRNAGEEVLGYVVAAVDRQVELLWKESPVSAFNKCLITRSNAGSCC